MFREEKDHPDYHAHRQEEGDPHAGEQPAQATNWAIGGGNGYNLWLMRNSFFQSLNICEAYLTKLLI